MTNEQAAFIAAIRANPNDRTARLVYADWLDEHNDPLGSYLRAECAAESAAPGSPEMTVALEQMLAAVRKAGHSLGGWEYEPTLDRIRQRLDPLLAVERESGDEVRDLVPAPETDVLDFELRHGVLLPREYRAFLLCVGNGTTNDGWGWGVFDVDLADDFPNLRVPFPHQSEVIAALRYEMLSSAGAEVEPPLGYDPDDDPEQSSEGCLVIGQPPGNGSVLLGVNGPIRGQVWTEGDWYGPWFGPNGRESGFFDWLEENLGYWEEENGL